MSNRFDSISNPQKKDNWIQVETLPPSPIHKNKRIVQTEKLAKAEISPMDAYLGEQNQHADRQTVSRNKNIQAGGSESKGQSRGRNGPKKSSDTPKSLSHLALQILPTRPMGDSGDREWATPGIRPQDTIAGIQESDRTALNTREFKFYGYFQRIRDRLDRAWVPILRERLVAFHYAGRHLASNADYTTQVLVVLNPQGEITKVVVVGESGTQELDSAAIAAFNKAGPFPNPPKGILDRDQEVKIPWDFVLKT